MAVTGTVSRSVLLPCSLNSSATIDPKRLQFYWQDKDSKVLYSFDKGEENRHQDSHYKNKTEAFKIEMSSGNLSIQLNNLTLQDQNTYLVFATMFSNTDKPLREFIKVCHTSLDVAAWFPTQEWHPQIKVTCSIQGGYPQPKVTCSVQGANPESEVTCSVQSVHPKPNVTCLTRGGYPQSKVTWIIQDQSQRQVTLGPWEVQTNITLDPDDGMYTACGQVHFPENQTMMCHIFNLLLGETASNKTQISVESWVKLQQPAPPKPVVVQQEEKRNNHLLLPQQASPQAVLVLMKMSQQRMTAKPPHPIRMELHQMKEQENQWLTRTALLNTGTDSDRAPVRFDQGANSCASLYPRRPGLGRAKEAAGASP
ncbi:uncharacterized protein LOC117593488 [Esox lucius]|uniref:uncharacterized protein LOC117593488 n=1 Tax=Esox lucius TaxID=8010 RepID=UPI0014775B39|nr:uncharacterized protein LOC117593488 [Esox lucius]